MTPSEVEGSILQTLKYSDHFGFPLALEEIVTRFVGANPCGRPQIIFTINQLFKSGLIQKTGDFYHLPGRSSLVERRLLRAKISAPQLSRARALSSKISNLKSILAIYLTGSLAMKNSNQHSDIDFMIITKPNRLWTTRFILTIYTTILGLRRTPGSHKNSGKLCLNLYLTPTTYDLPATKRNLYTAYELIQAVPLYDPHNTHRDLLAANPWISNFLPNYPLPRKSSISTIYDPRPTIFEKLSYHLQLLYMRKKITREYITRDSAFFHPRDPSPKV